MRTYADWKMENYYRPMYYKLLPQDFRKKLKRISLTAKAETEIVEDYKKGECADENLLEMAAGV